MKVAVFTVSLPEHSPVEAIANVQAWGCDGWIAIDNFCAAAPRAARIPDDLAFLKCVEARVQGGGP
jgi:hypothetical protein